VTGPLPAVAFLTRLPVPGDPPSMRDVARAQGWFPAVGLLIGVALIAVDRLAMQALPAPSVDVLAVVALVLATGALHLDGLADCADGLLGGREPSQRLVIMRDVRTGAFGVTAIVCVLAMKWAGLQALPSDVRVEALLLAPCTARASLLVAVAAFPYARQEGIGVEFRENAVPVALLASAATATIASVGLLGAGGISVMVAGATCALAVGAVAARLAGGLTGDVYGAIVEITEAVLWLCIAALANRGWLDAWLLA
jgi:adenosylcobinamide-GDP ribazoletransferase